MTNGLRASIKRKHDLLDQLEKSPTEEKIQTYKTDEECRETIL